MTRFNCRPHISGTAEMNGSDIAPAFNQMNTGEHAPFAVCPADGFFVIQSDEHAG